VVKRLPLIFLFNAVFAGVCCAAAPLAPDEDSALLARLLAGEVVARESSGDSSGGSARMQVLVQASPRAVWDVIVSCELAFRFIAGLRQCEVREDTGDRALVRQVVDQGWLVPTFDFVFESLRQPWQRIDIRLVEGNLAEMEGSWSFVEMPGGTLVDYEVRLRPQAPVPAFLVRRNISRTMPDLLACVRGLAEGRASEERRRRDLARCAGPA
jgi:ribosome-associated toxin RatA of RatAB toxin-antitoxin module